jgi:hypothetical protein
MIKFWKVGHGTADTQAIALSGNDERPDKDVLYYPQDNGMNQDSIDALFD